MNKVNPHKRHLVYLNLIYKGLGLNVSHARQIAKHWYDWPDFDDSVYNRVWHKGVRSAPSEIRSLIVATELAKWFDLEGVAGFYKSGDLWRLNLSTKHGALVRPYRDGDNRIVGLLIFKHLNDKDARLLTSRNLPSGTKAEVYYPERMAA